MWIAVLGFVKIFPNLEATGLGVFNRVLKFFRKTSTSFHRRVGWREMLNILARASRHIRSHIRSRVSHALHAKQYHDDIKAQGRPLLERPRRTASPPARVPARPPGQVGPMESIRYAYRLHRQHFPYTPRVSSCARESQLTRSTDPNDSGCNALARSRQQR